MTIDGTIYVTDSAGTAVDVGLMLDGHVTVCVLAEGDAVATLDLDEVQALIDALTFFRTTIIKYGATS